MTKITLGKALLTLTSFGSAYGTYHFGWNDTHIYNPEWKIHLKKK